MAGGGGAFMTVGQHQAGRRKIERQPQHGRDQQHRRKGREFERRLDEQRRHQDQHREDDRDGERKIEQERRQRQDQDDQNRHHADGEQNVAALEHVADVAERRHLQPDAEFCRCVGHGAVRAEGVIHAAIFAGCMVSNWLTPADIRTEIAKSAANPILPKFKLPLAGMRPSNGGRGDLPGRITHVEEGSRCIGR